MAYTAQQLITRAFYLAGITAREAQAVSGEQLNDGLNLLNSLLDFKQVETDLIPYFQYIELTATAGQEYYFLPYVASVESLTFNLDVVRYPMDNVSRRNYYGSARVDNIASLPFSYNYNRALGGGNLAMYFLPESDFPLKMMVKIFLVDVELTTDLTNISEVVPYTFVNNSNQGYDTSYIEYLRYALAEYICSDYGILFNPQSMEIKKALERKLMYVGPPDLSMKKVSILFNDSNPGWNYGDVNIGRGFRPS